VTVCVLGSFMMDLSLRAPRRPQPGETVVGTAFDMFLGGKGFNQAVGARRSGADTVMIGRLGADDFGQRFLDCLTAEGIDRHHVTIDPEGGTGVGVPLVEDSGENSIVIVPRANHRITVADIDAAADSIATSQVLLLQLELPVDVVLAAARHAKAAGCMVVLNPAPAVVDVDQFAGLVDVLVPNEVEAMHLSGNGADPVAAGVALRRRTGASVVVTVGGDGAIVLDGADHEYLAAHDVTPVDTVGAGDAFCGALGARLANGDDLATAAAYANAAAALSVTKAGAEPSIPTRADIDAFLVERQFAV
jgi:ribokinase